MKYPQAFPMQFLGINHGALSYEDTENQEGMTLRDYFAAAAMQGLISNQTGAQFNLDPIIRDAYFIADNMLEARKWEHPEQMRGPKPQ